MLSLDAHIVFLLREDEKMALKKCRVLALKEKFLAKKRHVWNSKFRTVKEAIKQYKKKYMKEYYVKNKEKIQDYQKHYRESKKINVL